MESAAAFLAADAVQKRAAIAIDDEGDQNKKQKLSDSVVATTTDDGDDDYSTYVRVIPTSEEKLPCHTDKCDKDAAFSWASNSNRNDIRNFCEGCQVIESGGGRPNGVVPIKYSADEDDNNNQVDTQVEAAAATSGEQQQQHGGYTLATRNLDATVRPNADTAIAGLD